jgi:shikimate kinase
MVIKTLGATGSKEKLMKCVLLIGFSTTGKSTILRDFHTQHGETLETLDSDTLISQPDGGHIYNIFLRYRQGSSTAAAIGTIENREREFLRTIMPTTKRLLIASGPFLPIRQPDWNWCNWGQTKISI